MSARKSRASRWTLTALNVLIGLVILLVSGWVWLGTIIAVGLLVLKCVSLGWLLKLGLPVPVREPAASGERA